MRDKWRSIAAGITATALVCATPAAASVQGTIHLWAHVPVYCNVELIPASPGTDQAGVIALGTSSEFCNSPRGYRIILDHPSHLTTASVISGTQRIPLADDGETVLWDSDRPGIEQRQLALDLGGDPATIDRLGLRIEVKY